MVGYRGGACEEGWYRFLTVDLWWEGDNLCIAAAS